MTTKRDNQKKKTGKTDTVEDRRGTEDRRSTERRAETDRRERDQTVAENRRSQKERRAKGATGERRKVERRINEYRLDDAVLEFINAVNEFKSVEQKPFPTWSEIYKIFIDLGYRKVDQD